MHFLKTCPPQWGPWNHASLTSLSKRGAEIKIGIRKGFSMKGILSLRKSYELNPCNRSNEYRKPSSLGILLGNLIGWLWLKNEVYPKHMKFLHPYLISHPRAIGHSFSDFCWEEMTDLDFWTLDQGGGQVKYKNTEIQFKWRVEDGEVYGSAHRLSGDGKIQIEVFGTKCNTHPQPVKTFQDKGYNINIFSGDSVYFSTAREVEKEKILHTFQKERVMPRSSGKIRDSLESIITVIGINSLKPPDRDWLTSLMRRASVLLKGWNIYLWDNSFIGLMATINYPKLAKGNLRALCSEVTHHGFLPNQAHPLGRSEGITQLPVTSYCALKTDKILNSSEDLIPALFSALKSNNNWWLNNRDPNGFHLLSYGSELEKRGKAVLKQNAQYESGMDNHPMFDDAMVDYESGCITMYPVGLNSIYALDCESLSQLAESQGDMKTAKKLRIRYRNMKKMMNEYLWDGKMYRNRAWSGEFENAIFSTYLFPLIAGIPSKKQAESLVKNVLKECMTSYGLAPSSIFHPSFKDQITWRGRLLPPVQFLVSEGLRRYEFDLEASHLARRCYRCFHKEWREESHFHESYNGFTGEGDDVSITGEPGHPWAALFPYLTVQDFIDYESWPDREGLRLGRLEPIKGAVHDIPIRGKRYSVIFQGKQMKILKGGNLIMDSNYPCILRRWTFNDREVIFSQKTRKPCDIRLYLPMGSYNVHLNDETFEETIGNRGSLGITLTANKNKVKIKKL